MSERFQLGTASHFTRHVYERRKRRKESGLGQKLPRRQSCLQVDRAFAKWRHVGRWIFRWILSSQFDIEPRFRAILCSETIQIVSIRCGFGVAVTLKGRKLGLARWVSPT